MAAGWIKRLNGCWFGIVLALLDGVFLLRIQVVTWMVEWSFTFPQVVLSFPHSLPLFRIHTHLTLSSSSQYNWKHLLDSQNETNISTFPNAIVCCLSWFWSRRFSYCEIFHRNISINIYRQFIQKVLLVMLFTFVDGNDDGDDEICFPRFAKCALQWIMAFWDVYAVVGWRRFSK